MTQSPDLSQVSPTAARIQLVLWVLLAAAGTALAINRGQLPQRESGANSAGGDEATAPDLRLYREVVADVRAGIPYYASARHQIPWHGFPISSPLNWRLPTYAWLFALLPGPRWIQAALIALSLAALALAWSAQSKAHGAMAAVVTCLVLVGVLRWALDGDAYLAQEPWAATLLIVSLSAHALGSRWRALAIAAGLAALFFRELALPYCGVACLLAMWQRRWREGALWTLGIAAFFAFYAWHVGQIRVHLAGSEPAAAGGLSQWLRFGGLDFVLLTTRMNGLLFSAPGVVIWLYLLAALFGLSSRADETSQLAALATTAYLLAFGVVGRSENFYWGLLPAPLLAMGVCSVPAALAQYCNAAFRAATQPGGTGLPAAA